MRSLFFIIAITCLLSSSLSAQTNLIYNGDFELYDTCPNGFSQLSRCLGWKNPTNGTPDYFNVCAAFPTGLSIPSSGCGFQGPFSGNAYAGIYFENAQPPLFSNGFWFEYLQGDLLSTLHSGYEYEFSCRISLANYFSSYAIWKLGAEFSDSPISRTDTKSFGFSPDVMNASGNFITDTSAWVELKGSFMASGGEKYVTIGLFTDTTQIDTLMNGPPDVYYPLRFSNYYFVDDCRLRLTKVPPLPNVFTPNGDGINDEFDFSGIALAEEIVRIYNRWGNLVFQSDLNTKKWDGRDKNGNLCADGVYYYLFGYSDFINRSSSAVERKGFIQVLK